MASDSTELKIDVQEPSSWSRRLSITVPASRVKRERTRVAEQFARNARLPGFRKGKLPARVVEQRFGPSIEQEALDRLIQEAYREAVSAQGFTPITQGKVDNVHYHGGEELHFEVEFEVQPAIELERVSGFTVSRPALEVGEEDVDSVLERLRDERATWEAIPEGESPDYGDQVLVDITALDAEGAVQPGEEPRSYRFVIGEGQAIPEVEDAIRTLKPGEEGTFTVHFPDDFPDEERRGAEQHLHVSLKGAQRKVLATVDDEFAKTVGEFESVAALRERILSDLREDASQRAEAEVRSQLVDQLLEANAFEVPGSMVDRYLDYMMGRPEDAEGRRATPSPEEAERLSKLREGLRPQAEIGLKRMLVVDRLAEREGLRATQDEIDARVEQLAEKHGRSPSEVWIQLEKSGQLEMLEREITEENVFRYLTGQNTVA